LRLGLGLGRAVDDEGGGEDGAAARGYRRQGERVGRSGEGESGTTGGEGLCAEGVLGGVVGGGGLSLRGRRGIGIRIFRGG
jgi:hypothetical protein